MTKSETASNSAEGGEQKQELGLRAGRRAEFRGRKKRENEIDKLVRGRDRGCSFLDHGQARRSRG